MDQEEFEYEQKKLALEIKENIPKYISGELYLHESLERTDELYKLSLDAAEHTTANRVYQDSGLMQLQSKIIRQCTKSFKPDTLVFDARTFSLKLKSYFSSLTSGQEKSSSSKVCSTVWQKLGEECKKNINATPTFNFIYGTFKPDPVSPVKRKRKRYEKDKIADVTKPQTINLSENSEGKDVMLSRATRTLSILIKHCQRSGSGAVCFYNFVTDPSSFTRTIENIFTVSLLVQNGHACIFEDEQGLPGLRHVKEGEKKERQLDPNGRIQSVISMSVEEWKAIINKFNFKTALIPPPRTQQPANHNM